MTVIINQDGVKRQLRDAPFEICVDRAAMGALLTALQREDPNFTYGWITIAEPQSVLSIPSTPPLPWTHNPIPQPTDAKAITKELKCPHCGEVQVRKRPLLTGNLCNRCQKEMD